MLDNTATNVTYRLDGAQSVFPIPFPFLESSHIRAWVRAPGGAPRALAAGGDYVVNMISDEYGEFIMLGDDVPGDGELTISRLVPLTQEIFFHNQGPNSPRAMEAVADKLTMIAQQLDGRVDNCLFAPEGFSADEMSRELADTAGKIADLRDAVSAMDGLKASLDAKVDIGLFYSGLLKKADATALKEKAERQHLHPAADVHGLVAALERKLDVDDPRLDGLNRPSDHAASHFADGGDRIRPEDIGSLSAPPSDGKTYLAVGGGWVEYIAPGDVGDGTGIGTFDHSRLLNRNAADQHPQSAIQGLPGVLEQIHGSMAIMKIANEGLAQTLAAKADKSELPGPATAGAAGLLSAADKQKLDALSDAVTLPPAEAADRLPLMSVTQKGVARLSVGGGLELDGDGALGICADNRISNANVNASLSAHEARIEEGESRMSGLTARMGTAEGTLGTLGAKVNSLGAMSKAADAPADGRGYMRRNGAWVECADSTPSSGGALIGEIRLLPFRAVELPEGWYLCNGDQFSLASAQGDALYSLPVLMKADWGISVTSGNISLPNLFQSNDGYFLRAVNNSARYPGNKQSDAMRNITAHFGMADVMGLCWHATTSGTSALSGAFYSAATKKYGATIYNYGATTTGDLYFDASRCVPTAGEFRPKNVGMTPAIYLGV